MNKALGCQVICLDHISILVSGMTGKVTDERRLVDDITTRLRTEVQALGITLLMVSHLKRPSGDLSHEQGARLGLNQIRSSHSLAQLSDQVIGLEVDRDDPTSGMRNVVILKNRHTGTVGHCGTLQYDKVSGRLSDASKSFGF
jgi:twinkle protein